MYIGTLVRQEAALNTLHTILGKFWYSQNSFLRAQMNNFSDLFEKFQDCFEDFLNVLSVFGLWMKNFRYGCQKWLSFYVSRRKFDDKNIFRNITISDFFRIVNQTISKFERKFFGRIIKTAYYVSREKTWEKLQIHYSFRIVSLNFLEFEGNFRHGCQNCILRVQRSPIEEEKIEKMFIVINFFGVRAKNFRTLSKKFKQGMSKLLLHVQSNFLVKKNYRKKCTFINLFRILK